MFTWLDGYESWPGCPEHFVLMLQAWPLVRLLQEHRLRQSRLLVQVLPL
jgi:hypothetical protein